MSNILIVDRIESNFAICERSDKSFTQIPLSQLPPGVREGDCLCQEGGRYIIDTEETARRRAALNALFNRLKKPR